MRPDSLAPAPRGSAPFGRIVPAWREPLGALAFASALLVLVCAREWGEMLHQWWAIDTYSHILLIPFIMGWLVATKRADLADIVPQAWLPGLGVVAAGLLLWLLGRVNDINLLAHAGAVAALEGVVLSVLGPRVALVLALPLGMGVFLVPFGDEIIPPLQMITAKIAIALTQWSGVPAEIDGINIATPAGLFIVAEACSGVRFLIAMVALAVLVSFTALVSWRQRALFMLAAIIVPVLANGVRAWGTIYLAQIYGAEWATGFDHIVYGWVFFAIVVAGMLGAAWRWFERAPEDHGWSAGELETLPLFSRLNGLYSPLPAVLSLLALLALAGSALASFVPAVPVI
jgi:exosortase A